MPPPRSCSPRKVFSVIGEASLPGADQRAGDLVDAAVNLLDEMLGCEEIRDAVVGVVVDQDGAEQRLFGLDIGRRAAVGAPPGRLPLRAGGSGRLDSRHGERGSLSLKFENGKPTRIRATRGYASRRDSRQRARAKAFFHKS